jgi:hypothetical protein
MYISFHKKKLKRSHKIVEIKVFITFLLVDGRIRIREAQHWIHRSTTLTNVWFMCTVVQLYVFMNLQHKLKKMIPFIRQVSTPDYKVKKWSLFIEEKRSKDYER